jgi:hypothetical protein
LLAEHPFEAQTINMFFEKHLTSYLNPQKRDCAWIRKNIIDLKTPWNNAGGSVLQLMMREMGTKDNPGRLAVFVSRSNRLKGTLSGWKTAVNTASFDLLKPGDEQISYAKEFGMIFSYWNIDEIWSSYCDSYNGMRDVLGNFDTEWDRAHPNDPSGLQAMWQSFNKDNLREVTTRGRAQAMSMYNRRHTVGGLSEAFWIAKWWAVYSAPLVNQYSYIKLDKPCRNLQ